MKNKEQIAKIWDVLDSLNIDVLQNKKDISRIDEVLSVSNLWEPQKPKLKQLDQSVFDHPYATDRFKYVALNADGQTVFFESKPVISNCLDIWVVHTGSVMPMLNGYDASDWQNSLIERKELTGSDLARAMLERGDKYVLCFVSDFSDDCAVNQSKMINLVTHKEGNSIFAKSARWKYAVPINQQTGEPLTQSEAGL